MNDFSWGGKAILHNGWEEKETQDECHNECDEHPLGIDGFSGVGVKSFKKKKVHAEQYREHDEVGYQYKYLQKLFFSHIFVLVVLFLVF